MKILYLLLLLGVSSDGSKILVLFPVPGPSHGILGESLVRILLDGGHQVTYVSPFPPESRGPNLTYVDISSAIPAMLGGQRQLSFAMLAAANHPTFVFHVGPGVAKGALQHPSVQALLHDPKASFDVVLAEWFFSGLLAPLAEVFDCPLIWYRSSDVCWQALRLVHEASSPTYSRDLHATLNPATPFTTVERLYQGWLQLYLNGWIYFNKHIIELPAYEALYREPLKIRGKSLPEYDSLVYNASLMFSNSHPPLGQQLPLPLNVKYVGGHHIELVPPPLPKRLKRIMDEAKHGVIYFSLGSILKGKELPEEMKTLLLEVFGRLNQTVIWKLEEVPERIPKNVHIIEWAPQQSILDHSNTVLFITHGGILSMLEATQFGVPIIGVPVYADQFANIDLAVSRGVGIKMDLFDDFPNKLNNAVEQILNNNSYRANTIAASNIFRRRLVSPQQELTHWLQLVVDTNGAGHLRSPALQVSPLSRLYLDVLLFIILVLWLVTKLMKIIKICLNFTSNSDLEKKNV